MIAASHALEVRVTPPFAFKDGLGDDELSAVLDGWTIVVAVAVLVIAPLVDAAGTTEVAVDLSPGVVVGEVVWMVKRPEDSLLEGVIITMLLLLAVGEVGFVAEGEGEEVDPEEVESEVEDDPDPDDEEESEDEADADSDVDAVGDEEPVVVAVPVAVLLVAAPVPDALPVATIDDHPDGKGSVKVGKANREVSPAESRFCSASYSAYATLPRPSRRATAV